MTVSLFHHSNRYGKIQFEISYFQIEVISIDYTNTFTGNYDFENLAVEENTENLNCKFSITVNDGLINEPCQKKRRRGRLTVEKTFNFPQQNFGNFSQFQQHNTSN